MENKFKLVYPSADYNDSQFKVVANMCVENNWRLVLILPTCKEYPHNIIECFNILGDDLLIYEVGMGMGNVLESRAHKYIQYHTNSKLYEKN